jgi:hypothetical protein
MVIMEGLIMAEKQSKNHICFIGDHEFFRYDQTVRCARKNDMIDSSNGFRMSSLFVCYLNSWDKTKERMLSGHITI